MSPTIDDIEHEMTIRVLEQQARENAELARFAIQMVGVLVMKLGGEVEITHQDVLRIQAFNLAQITRHEDGTMVLRVERRQPN